MRYFFIGLRSCGESGQQTCAFGVRNCFAISFTKGRNRLIQVCLGSRNYT